MRRRHSINIWPAFADLMTVLTIVGLFTAIGLLPYQSRTKERKVDSEEQYGELVAEIFELRTQIGELKELVENLKEQKNLAEVSAKQIGEKLFLVEWKLREAAENEEMFDAIQEAQRVIDNFFKDFLNSGLDFNKDQSLQFGDDLVSFSINSIEPNWSNDGQNRLRDFCEKLSQSMARIATNGRPVKDLLTVQVEGHTDSTVCRADANCNWRFSSGRAAAFVAKMRDSRYCTDGNDWDLRSIGYADKRPLDVEGEKITMRRITIRLVPNYGAIIGEESEDS